MVSGFSSHTLAARPPAPQGLGGLGLLPLPWVAVVVDHNIAL